MILRCPGFCSPMDDAVRHHFCIGKGTEGNLVLEKTPKTYLNVGGDSVSLKNKVRTENAISSLQLFYRLFL